MKKPKSFLRVFLIGLAASLPGLPAKAAIIVSKVVATSWATPSTWVGGVVPGTSDSVVIVAGAVISTGTNQSCGAINILGTLTLTGGNFLTVAGDGITSFGSVAGNGTLGYTSIGNRNISLTGNWTFSGTSSNTGENVTFDGTGNQTLQGVITTGIGGSGLITINNSGGQVIMESSMAFSNQGLSIQSGTFNPNGFAITINKLTLGAGTLIVDAATWAGDYTVTTIGSPSAGNTILYTNTNPTIYSAITYQNLSFSGSGTAGTDGNLTIQGNLTNTGGGTLAFGTDNVTISGTVSANSIAGFSTTGTISFTKTAGTSTLTGNITSGPLTMNGNGGTLNLGLGLTHAVTNLAMTKGTLNGGSSTLDISGTWTGTVAVFTAGTGTVSYVSGSAQTISVTPTYYNLTVSGAGTKTIAASPLNVTGTLMLSTGSFLAPTGTTSINVGGNWTNNGGTFTFTNTTVILNGSAAQTIGGTQTTTFNKLTISTSGANTVLGVATSITNQLSLTSGNLDATNYSLTINAGAPAITGASASDYIITGNGATTTGELNINSLATNTADLFPIGTSSYYMPVTVNPGATTGENFSVFVFQGATTNGAANGTPISGSALSKIVNAIWDISRTSGSGSATIALNWAASGTALEGSVFQTYGLDIGVSHYTGGSWQIASGSGSVSSETATSSFSSFSPFSVRMNGTPLSLVLIDFNAMLNNDNAVFLSWDAAPEIGSAYFDILRSTDRSGWQTIGTVQAKGNAPQQTAYSYIDAGPASGINYYRLKIANMDGSITYSEIKSVSIPPAKNIRIYPNPASSILNVSISNLYSDLYISLFNESGKLLQTIKVKSSQPAIVHMPIGDYPPGPYLVEIATAEGIKQTSMVLISRP